MLAKSTRSSLKIIEVEFPGEIELNKKQNYDFDFDYIVNDYECGGKIRFQFSLRYQFENEDDTISIKKEIFVSDFQYTNKPKKWESKNVCFSVDNNNKYDVIYNLKGLNLNY